MMSEQTRTTLEEKEKEMSPYLRRRFQVNRLKNIQRFLDITTHPEKKKSLEQFLGPLNTIHTKLPLEASTLRKFDNELDSLLKHLRGKYKVRIRSKIRIQDLLLVFLYTGLLLIPAYLFDIKNDHLEGISAGLGVIMTFFTKFLLDKKAEKAGYLI